MMVVALEEELVVTVVTVVVAVVDVMVVPHVDMIRLRAFMGESSYLIRASLHCPLAF